MILALVEAVRNINTAAVEISQLHLLIEQSKTPDQTIRSFWFVCNDLSSRRIRLRHLD